MAENKDARVGRSTIGSIEITNFNETETKDIKSLVLETAIYEDIFSSSVSAEFAILDATRFLDEFPIVGDETLVVNFSSSGGAHHLKPNDSMESIQATFKTYRVDSRMAVKDRAETYVLRATTLPHLLDYTHIVDYAVGPAIISQIVRRLYEKHIQPWTAGKAKKINIDPSDGLHQFVFPKLSPMRAMTFLAEEARSYEFKNSTYHFFETHRAYHFVTLDSLFQQLPVESFVWIPQNLKTTFIDQYTLGSLSFSRHQIIMDYTEGTSFDTLLGVSQGQFGTTTQILDPLIKQYSARPYHYHWHFDFTKRIGGTVLGENTRVGFPTIPVSKDPKNTLVESTAHSRYLIGRASPPTDFMRDRGFTDYARQRHKTLTVGHAAMVQFQNTSTITIKVPGHSALTAGQIINVFIPKMGEGPTADLGDQYLIVSLVHKFGLNNEYITILECMRNAYASKILNIPSKNVGTRPRIPKQRS